MDDSTPGSWKSAQKESIQHIKEVGGNSIQQCALFSSNATEAVYRLKYTIQQKAVATKFNNVLALDNEAVPPIQRGDPRDVLELLEEWIRENEQPYCVLLGEYGMGKTMACMRFTQQLLEKRQNDCSLPLPIYLDLRNIGAKDHCDTMELVPLIDEILKNSLYAGDGENILRSNDVIRLVQENGALVIFDGLDEVLVHLSTVAGQHFTHQLLSILPLYQAVRGRVLITCRTHYFRTIREQKTHFMGQSRTFILQPFTDEQIREYLAHVLPDIDIDTLLNLIRSVHNLSELAERPYILSLIPELIPYIEQWKKESSQVTGVIIYRHMILSWLERDTGRHQLTTDHKQQLMEHFAAELWRSGKKVWNVVDIERWFVHFLRLRPEIKKHYTLGKEEALFDQILDMLHGDLRAATFLVRVGEGDFRFAHTSLQEFFLATYLYRALMEGNVEAWNLPVVSKETLDFLGQLLSEGENVLALATLQSVRDTYRPHISEQVLAYMLFAHLKAYPTPVLAGFRLEGANLQDWSIVGKAEKLLNFRGASFRGANLNGANLRYLNLDHADFTDAQLANIEIIDSRVAAACFEGADLRLAVFKEMKEFRRAFFVNAQFHQTRWVRCQLKESLGLSPKPLGTLFISCEPADQYSQEFIEDGNHLAVFDGHQDAVCACAFSSGGQYLVSASWDTSLRIWDVVTGECVKVLSGHQGRVRSCAFSPNDRCVVSISDDQSLKIWNVMTGECLKVFSCQDNHGTGRSCVFSPDGRLLASAADEMLKIWDTATGECLKVLSGHKDQLRSCIFSPNGQYVASASEDETLRIWEVGTGECLKVLIGHTSWVHDCAFSLDGKQLVSASGDKTLRIWDMATMKSRHVFQGHEGRVRGCAFSPDGKQLLSSSDDYTLRIWDVAKGECLKILRGHQGRVFDCVFSPNGKIIASASDDHTLRIWNAATDKCLHVLGRI